MIIPEYREGHITPNYPTQAQIDAFNDLFQECQKLQAENTALREKYYELEEKLERTERRIIQLELELAYEDNLFANASLSPAHQTVLRTIRKIIHILRIDETTPTPIRQKEIANKTGLSEAQIRRITNELDTWGFIKKETKQWKEGKKWQSEMLISIDKNISKIPSLKAPKRNHGGARKQKCEKCGSEDIEPVVYQCNKCGHHGPIE